MPGLLSDWLSADLARSLRELILCLACQVAGSLGLQAAPVDEPVELTLLTALPIEGPSRLEPSGLVFRDQRLFAVSDKHPDSIFEVVREEGRALFRTALVFSPPAGTAARFNLDLEGITVDSGGRFHLASEAAFRVLIVDENGSASWATPTLKPAGHAAGLFTRPGGGLEGIHWLDEGRWLLVAERQSRGFLHVSVTDGTATVDAWPMDVMVRTPPKNRSLDFAGLCSWRGRLFVLERNLHLVSEVVSDGNRFVLGGSWSYARTENDPALSYADTTFGLAEGLAITDEEILVVTDNNGIHRAGDTQDRRPQLLVFRNPLR